MTTRRLEKAMPPALAVAAFALALLQRPGWSSSDTKIDLHTDPVRFLADVASVWTPTGGLGGVASAQYSGYLFPMGPFFAALHAVGVPDWLADRLWLGLVLALGCWGVVRLGDVLFGRPRGVAHAVAGLLYLVNPYVVVFTNRTTVTLLAYAALPWLVLLAHRGVREPRGWRLPACFALIVTAGGAGVNAAVVAFVLIGPALMLVYEPLIGGASWRDARAFAGRAVLATLVASLWWMAPVVAQSRYGVDFLRFTEPAGAIWATTSLTESLRLMGYWIAYIGVGFDGVVRPYFSDAGVLLFQPLVLAASLLVPGLALAAFAGARRRRYAPLLLALVLVGALLMTIGFPEGTPLRRGVTWAYNHVPAVRFLRTTYKAGPLVALGLAGLAGMGAAALAERLRGRPWLRAAAGLAAIALLALASWPLIRGRAVDRQVVWKQIPAAWTSAARDLDRTLPRDQRAIVLPGNLYAFYRWGGTVDPILPALARSPVAERNAVPYGDLHGTDLLWTTDALVQQERAFPSQLPPLLRLLGAGAVVTGSDDDTHRSGAADPAAAQRALASQGLGPPAASYGALTRFPSPVGDLGPSPILPQVRRWRVPDVRPAVRVDPLRPAVVVDGSAEGVAGLAAFGELRPGSLAYAGDLGSSSLRAAAAAGSEIVVSDSNRRRVFVVSRMRQNTGATLAAGDPISADAAVLNPFPLRGTAGQTVAVLHGARWVRAPFSPGYAQFPEHRPLAAFDGDPRTFWLADSALDPARGWVEIGFVKPLDIPYVDVLPEAEAGARPYAVEIGGRRFPVRPGWNRLRLNLRNAGSLRVLIRTRDNGSAGGGGLAEVRVPGVHVTESLRPPVRAEDALRGADLSRTPLSYVFARQTGDRPFRRSSTGGATPSRMVRDPGRLEALRVRDAGDAESSIDRVFSPPAARRWTADAWVGVSPEATDSALDRIAGYDGGVRVDSSGRFHGQPAFRGSAAFDGSPSRAWIAPLAEGRRPWLEWRTPAQHTITRLTLRPAPLHVRTPTVVELVWPGGRSGRLPVGPGGQVTLPRPVSAGTFRLEIADSRFPPGATARERWRDAVAIGELEGAGVRRISPPSAASPRTRCGDAYVDVAGTRILLQPIGTLGAFESGAPMRTRMCGAARSLPAGAVRLQAGGADFKIDLLRLRSAPSNALTAPLSPGSVTDTGTPRRASRDGVRVALHAPGMLVLGQSFSTGWRAYCDGRSLGVPRIADGYANGWEVKPPCTGVRFEFAPNTPVHWLQVLSALACLLLLAVALGLRTPAPRHRRTAGRRPITAEASTPTLADLPDPPPTRTTLKRALMFGLAAGVVLGFCFSLRAGLAIFAGVSVIVWLGIGPRLLAATAGVLLAVVVPALYLLVPATDFGGYDPGYAGDHTAAHWAGVAAFVLLVVALARTLSTASRRGAASARSAP